jgi:predicted outer membrane repeat protein
VNVTASRFTNSSAAVGGVLIAYTESIVRLEDVHMSSNTAVDAGAISAQSELHVLGCSFTNNTAQSQGGAIVGDAQSAITLYKTSFTNNTCQGKCKLSLQQHIALATVAYYTCHALCVVLIGNGGALLIAGAVALRSCNLTSNSGLSGGAVCTDNRASIGMKNCVLTDNTAQQSGVLFNCLFTYE